jgi:hypothetical protein
MTHASIFLIRIDSELGKLRNHKSESLSLAAGMRLFNRMVFVVLFVQAYFGCDRSVALPLAN